MRLKSRLRQLIPRWLLSIYHLIVSYGVAWCYGFPGRKITAIGVTGTKGKTTTANMIWYLLQQSGYKTGLISTAQLAMADKVWLNDLKMTMPSRRRLQQLLTEMVTAGCQYVVLETSSEGLAQWRHLGIAYRVAVFTNLSPEHIEAHGSYKKYRAAKGRLFSLLARQPISLLPSLPPTAIINLDDAAVDYFLQFKPQQIIGYTLRNIKNPPVDIILGARLEKVGLTGAEIKINELPISLSVGGEFNVYNALAATGTALALGLPLLKIVKSLSGYPGTPGRLEFIQQGQPFAVVVDYAHTANSLEQVYKILSTYGRLLAVLGACGGGRDKAKRPQLGKLAGAYTAMVWVTNEDPYDEDPGQIMTSVAGGASSAGKIKDKTLFIIPDRQQAIQQALQAARVNDIVIITGKGSEQWICLANGKKQEWDDREVVKQELIKLGFKV